MRERLDDVDLLGVDLLVARPLLQLRHVVPNLHAARPVAHVLAQQQVVHGTRADEVENLVGKNLNNVIRFESLITFYPSMS